MFSFCEGMLRIHKYSYHHIIFYLFQKSTFGSTTFGYRTSHITTYKMIMETGAYDLDNIVEWWTVSKTSLRMM
jgi:hypothetical protein